MSLPRPPASVHAALAYRSVLDPIERLEPRRHLAAGDPLDSFGRHGFAVTPYALYNVELGDLQPAPGGKLMASIANQYYRPTRPGVPADFVRFNADGTADATFGGIGAVDSFFGSVRRIAVRSDGRFYALGSDAHVADDAVSENQDWFLARFRADGRPDRSFGDRGRVRLDLRHVLNELSNGASDSLNDTSILDADGRLTLLANYKTAPGVFYPSILRFDAAGRRDPTFHRGRPILLTAGVDGLANASLQVADDGSVLAAGNREVRGRQTTGVLRLRPRGYPDATFGKDGVVTLDTVPLGTVFTDTPHAFFAPGGSVYVARTVLTFGGSDRTFDARLTRLTRHGRVDSSFNPTPADSSDAAGTVTLDARLFGDGPLLPLPDGGLITASSRGFERRRADGTLDAAFGRVNARLKYPAIVGQAMYGLSGFGLSGFGDGGLGDGRDHPRQPGRIIGRPVARHALRRRPPHAHRHGRGRPSAARPGRAGVRRKRRVRRAGRARLLGPHLFAGPRPLDRHQRRLRRRRDRRLRA